MNKQYLMEKHGLSEEQATNVESAYLESMKGFVPQSRLNQEIEKTKAEKARADGLESSIKSLEEYKGSTEGLQAQLDSIKEQSTADKKKYQEEIDRIAKRTALTLKLMNKETKPIDKAMGTLIEAYDLNMIKLNKNGEIESGFDEQDLSITESMSFCYPTQPQTKKPVIEGSEPSDGSKPDSPKRAETIISSLLNDIK